MNKAVENRTGPSHIVVIGASAGGIGALQELVGQLHKNMDAAFFVVMHLAQTGIGSFLVHKLQQVTELPCTLAEEDMPIKKGHIYIALPGKHLMVTKELVKLGLGPSENRWKPSVDVLFRSAAAAFDGRTVGIVLTGYLNDGTSGMMAIRDSGGTCIVQDPNEAEYPDMPLSVLNYLEVDFCISLVKMGAVLEEIFQQKKEEIPIPEEVKKEAAISAKVSTGISEVSAVGESSVFSCPDCGGVLFNIKQHNYQHFKCHTGHSYSQEDLLLKQEQGFESTLWVALRFLEERKSLLKSMEDQNQKKGFQRAAAGYREKTEELQVHINRLKQILIATQGDGDGKADADRRKS